MNCPCNTSDRLSDSMSNSTIWRYHVTVWGFVSLYYSDRSFDGNKHKHFDSCQRRCISWCSLKTHARQTVKAQQTATVATSCFRPSQWLRANDQHMPQSQRRIQSWKTCCWWNQAVDEQSKQQGTHCALQATNSDHAGCSRTSRLFCTQTDTHYVTENLTFSYHLPSPHLVRGAQGSQG